MKNWNKHFDEKAFAVIKADDFISLKYSIKNEIFKNSSLLSQYHNIKYEKIPELCSKYKIKKNLIKPLYLS